VPTSFPLDGKPAFVAPPVDSEVTIRNNGPSPALHVPDPGGQDPPVFGPDAASVAPQSETTIDGPTWFVSHGDGGAQLLVFD
jgi:hypothetical protein